MSDGKRIYTNLDFTHLTAEQRRKQEQSERRKEYIRGQYSKAEEVVQQGVSSAGRRFWFQRPGVYSWDPKVDNDINVVLQYTSLPVKERVVHPNGMMEIVLGPAAEEALRLGYFCSQCEERQPDDIVDHQSMISRAQKMGISIESHEVRERKRCAYCFHPLGMKEGEDIVDASNMTDEQKSILGDQAFEE